MLPSFEIYAQISSDRLMPWLPDNRNNSKFEMLLHKTVALSNHSSHSFFLLLRQTLTDIQAKLNTNTMDELAGFAGLSTSVHAKFPALQMTKMPAESARERFYQVLIDNCLAAGIARDELFVNTCEGPENRAFHLEKLMQALYSVMQLPLPLCDIDTEELRIMALLKLAMAVHLRHLQQLQNSSYNSEAAFTNMRVWLLRELQKMQPAVEVHSFLLLFDQFVQNEAEMKLKTAHPYPEPMPGRVEKGPESDLTEEKSMVQLVQGMTKDFNELKSVVELLGKQKKADKQAPYLSGQEVCKILHISRSTLKRHRDSGKINFFKVGNQCRYDVSQFQGRKEKPGEPNE